MRDRIAEIPDGSVDVVMCSPPFLALRKYGDNPAEMGSERTPADFLDALLELTSEFRRVLTPHGSIAIELGDTYSGSGGAGGDYDVSGLRDGQPRWTGSGERGRKSGDRTNHLSGNGWPLAKSLTLIPTLYPASLAYGWNMLNPAHTFDRWRIRNVIVWARPNPPVGALGDKVRPATSYITVACTSAKRWFDLDAVRTDVRDTYTPHQITSNGYRGDPREGGTRQPTVSHPAGAPPLDWWDPLADRINAALANAAKGGYSQEDLFGGEVKVGRKKEAKETAGAKLLREAWTAGELSYTDDAITLPTQPYPGAHYATWPETLAARLIKMLCPLRVCVECGEPSRRIVEGEPSRHLESARKSQREHNGSGPPPGPRYTAQSTTLGWSDCDCACYSCRNGGCPVCLHKWRPGHILDPFAGSGTTLAVAQGLGRDATGIELYEASAELCRQRVGMFLETS